MLVMQLCVMGANCGDETPLDWDEAFGYITTEPFDIGKFIRITQFNNDNNIDLDGDPGDIEDEFGDGGYFHIAYYSHINTFMCYSKGCGGVLGASEHKLLDREEAIKWVESELSNA